MSGVVPLRFFTRQHLNVMWPFMVGSSYILLKLVELADPQNVSEQDKRDSRTLSFSVSVTLTPRFPPSSCPVLNFGVVLTPVLRLPEAAQEPRDSS